MRRSNYVIKASNIYYWDQNQPDRLYQIAEEYYQKAQEYQQEHSYFKARIYFQKAEECYQKARDAYIVKKQADEAKKQADEARTQADEARRKAGEARKQADLAYYPQKAALRIIRPQRTAERPGDFFPPVAQQQPVCQQSPVPQHLANQNLTAPVQRPRPDQEDQTVSACTVKQSDQPASERIQQQLSEHQGALDSPMKTAPLRPISWRGKKHS
jgi:tetratricopeptide (TPR) repeat protein